MKRIPLILLVAAVWLAVPVARAQTNVTWNGGTGNWGSSGNWTPGVVPNNSGINIYNVQIDNGNGTTSVVNMNLLNATVNNITLDDTLQLNSGSTLTVLGLIQGLNSGTLSTQANSVLNANIQALGSPNITIGGTLNTSSVGLCCSSSLTLQPGSILNNSGIVGVSAGGGQIQIDGTFNNLSGALLGGGDLGFINGTGTFNNWGTFSYGFGTPSFGVVNNYESGIMNWGFSTNVLNNAGTIVGHGVIYVGGSSDTFNTGTINLGLDTPLTLAGGGNYVQTNGSTFLEGGNSINFNGGNAQFLGGQLAGCGSINGNLLMSGTVVLTGGPCNFSPLTINGTYTQTLGGAFTANLGGLFLGQDYNQMQITGNAVLSGILNLVVSGFVPNAGDSFVLMTYGSHSGTFSSINWSGLPTGMYFQVSYNQNDVTATVRPVPEPATLGLLMTGLSGLLVIRRRRKQNQNSSPF